GSMLVKKDALPHVSSRMRAKLIWLHDTPLKTDRQYYFKFSCKTTTGEISKLHHRIDVNTLAEKSAEVLAMNEIGLVDVNLTETMAFDVYRKNKLTGAFIIIDRFSNLTVGAGMIDAPLVATVAEEEEIKGLSDFEYELIMLVRKHFPHLMSRQ
ncbi:MAG: sulfate adenylyltransferase subunit CysN, partial [Alishewanella sp.]|nr:sulfate adenylyltransferase subunit CysN [Alishewanella sp.]